MREQDEDRGYENWLPWLVDLILNLLASLSHRGPGGLPSIGDPGLCWITELKMLVWSLSNESQAKFQMLFTSLCVPSVPQLKMLASPLCSSFQCPACCLESLWMIPINFGFWPHWIVHYTWVLMTVYFWVTGSILFSLLYSASQQKTRELWTSFLKT